MRKIIRKKKEAVGPFRACSAFLLNKSQAVFTESHTETLNQRQTLTWREQISKRQSGEQAVSVVSVVCVLGQLLQCVLPPF